MPTLQEQLETLRAEKEAKEAEIKATRQKLGATRAKDLLENGPGEGRPNLVLCLYSQDVLDALPDDLQPAVRINNVPPALKTALANRLGALIGE